MWQQIFNRNKKKKVLTEDTLKQLQAFIAMRYRAEAELDSAILAPEEFNQESDIFLASGKTGEWKEQFDHTGQLPPLPGAGMAKPREKIASSWADSVSVKNDMRENAKTSIDILAGKPRTRRELKDVLAELHEPFMDRVYRYADRQGMSDADLYKKAHIDKRHYGKIKNGQIRPTKQIVVALILALELNLDDALDLLSSAGYTLSNSIKFDLAIEFFIREGIYNTITINEALQNLGIELLAYY